MSCLWKVYLFGLFSGAPPLKNVIANEGRGFCAYLQDPKQVRCKYALNEQINSICRRPLSPV